MPCSFAFTTTSRGAFLVRASIVFTPILSTLAGEEVPRLMWAGAIVGLLGGILLTTDPAKAAADVDSEHSPAQLALLGDLIIVLAAGLWSMVMVRQSKHAPNFKAIHLGTAKLSVMAILSALWLVADILSQLAHGRPASAVWPGYGHVVLWCVLLWPAIGPWTTGEITQIEAQARISASHGQIILAMDPLISIGFAALASAAGGFDSSEQHLGPRGWVGGCILMFACCIAGLASNSHH